MNREEIIPIKERYKTLDKELSKISKNFEVARVVKNFSDKSNLKLFFDSEDYFAYVKDYSEVEGFFVREKESFKGSCGDVEREKICYFDFYLEIDLGDKKFPIYLREKDFSKSTRNIIYSDFFSHEEREHQIYWVDVYEEKILKHPLNSKKIHTYYKGKRLNSSILKNLNETVVKIRKDHPEKKDSGRR